MKVVWRALESVRECECAVGIDQHSVQGRMSRELLLRDVVVDLLLDVAVSGRSSLVR